MKIVCPDCGSEKRKMMLIDEIQYQENVDEFYFCLTCQDCGLQFHGWLTRVEKD